MLYPMVNAELKGIKMESSDDAIKRGIVPKTNYDVEANKRRRVKNTTHIVIETEKDYNSQDDTHTANDYLRAKQLGFFN